MTTQTQTGRFLSNKELLKKRAQKEAERKKIQKGFLPQIEKIWEEFAFAREIANAKVEVHDAGSSLLFYLKGDFTRDGKIVSVEKTPQLVLGFCQPNEAELTEEEVETPGGFYGRHPWSIFGMGHPKDLADRLANDLGVIVTLFESTMYLGRQCSQWYTVKEVYRTKPQQLVES